MFFWFWNPIPHVSWGYNKGIYVITVQGERRRQVYLDYAEPQPVMCMKMLWRVCFVPTLHKGTTRSLLSVLGDVGLLWITCLLWVCLLVSVCFGLHECVLLKKWAETRQTHYSAFCVAPGNWLMLLFTMYLHFFKIGRKINLSSWDSFNFECLFISISYFLAITGFYDWICKEVTHVWIKIWFSSFLIFVYIHLYDIREAKVTCFLSLPCRLLHQARHKLFRKDDILHIKKGTGDRLMSWYVLHLVALRDTDLSRFSCDIRKYPMLFFAPIYSRFY